MGVYQWGSLIPQFRLLSPAKAQDFPRSLASLITRSGNWKSPAEFRIWACLSHELTHYLQDLTTGIGHRDHVTRNRLRPEMLSRVLPLCAVELDFPVAAVASANVFPEPPLSTLVDEAQKLHADLREELVMVVGDAVSPARRTAFEVRAAPMLVAGGQPDNFQVESLLEGEAAVTVMRQVFRLEQATERQWEILGTYSSAWNPDVMSPQYGGLLSEVMPVMWHLFGEDPESLSSEQRRAFYEVVWTLTGLLTDIACAHPSRELLANRGEDRCEYDPGLRFLRLLAAVGSMSETELGVLIPASGAHDLERAEEILLARCAHPYIPTRLVYEDWLPRFDAFDTDAPEGTQWAEKLRADCCRIRLEQPGAFIDKSPFSILEHKLPFTVLGPGGTSSIGQRWEHLEPDALEDRLKDLLVYDTQLGVFDFFFETGQFVCPLAAADVCSSAIDACREGMERTSTFPSAPGCKVRDWLEGSGAYLGSENG